MSDHQIDAISYMVSDLAKPRPRWWRWGQVLFTRRYSIVDLTAIYFIYRFFVTSQLGLLLLVCVVGAVITIWGERYFKLRPPMRRKANVRPS